MTTFRWILTGVGAVALVFGLAWVLTGIGIFGPGNVRDQWRFAYDYDESLRAIARQHCAAEALVKEAVGAEKVQRQSQAQAILNNYERVAAEYNGRLRDAFRAGLVAPPDVPDRAPTLLEMEAAECST